MNRGKCTENQKKAFYAEVYYEEKKRINQKISKTRQDRKKVSDLEFERSLIVDDLL